jgi:uncharacterized protein (TIGR03067 family)
MKRAVTIFSLVLMPVLLVTLGCSGLHKSSAGALQGRWSGREIGVVPEAPRQLAISGSHVDYRGAITNDWGKGTFTLRDDTQPKQLIITLTDCGFPQYIGKTCYMIYELRDGTLTAAANEAANPEAPSSFDAPHARRMVFKKE